MADDFKILVVCLGNVCRSPMAERLLQRHLGELLGDAAAAVAVTSAGVRAAVGAGMDDLAAAELRRLGGDPDGFVSRQLEPEMANEADLVLTANRDLRSRVLEEAPRALKRTFTIPEFAAIAVSDPMSEPRVIGTQDLIARTASWRGSVPVEVYDVPDPVEQSAQVHRQVADLLDDACTTIARTVAGALLSDVSG